MGGVGTERVGARGVSSEAALLQGRVVRAPLESSTENSPPKQLL